MNTEYQFYKIEPENKTMLKLKVRKNIPYKEIINLLLNGHEIFMPLDRKTAHYVKTELVKKTKFDIFAYPSIYNGMDGYLFQVNPDRVIKKALRGASEKKWKKKS